MAIQTPQQYHENENLWGKYQYVSLGEIVNELLLESTDEDSFLVNTPRSKIVNAAKNGIRFLNREIKKTILDYEITIGPSQYIELPQDYLDWVMVSVIEEGYKLKPLNINNNIPTAIGYLQDENYKLLFDENGEILTADSSNTYNKPAAKFQYMQTGQQAFLDTSQISVYGEFVIDEKRGTMGFSSNLVNREVVIKYISDGLQLEKLKEEEITFHKDYRQSLKEFMYNECVAFRRSVPANEKQRAKNAFLSTLHKLKVDRANFDINEMVRLKATATKL
jgi:hypothetical protein